ncbi:MAG: class I SAM-dependent methyltransferase [Christensenella sp.]|nr:class I SAM-dependent methyltransferase [Christensenella sp.]
MLRDKQEIQPRERLACAMELLSGARVVADVGCDHGRLSCALVQRDLVQRCIAIDVSAPSLGKAARLACQIGAQDRVETRLGDGLAPLETGEAEALAILGMGGTLMARILDVVPPLKGARLCVLQPMRAAEDIRRWLYERNYPVLDDRVVFEAGRYYQVFSIGQPLKERQPLPQGWPEDCFLLGYTAFARREPMMKPLTERMLASVQKKRRTQRSDTLDRQHLHLQQILSNWEEQP